MHPAQALDMQVDLHHRMQQDATMLLLYRQFVIDLVSVGNTEHQADRTAQALLHAIPAGLEVGSAYFVDPEMTEVIEWASAGLDDTDTFRYDELPTESGFVYFERPLVLHDIRGADLFINACVWTTARSVNKDTGEERSGTVFMMLNDHDRTPDDIGKKILANEDMLFDLEIYRQAVGRWGVIGCEFVFDGMQIGAEVEHLKNDAKLQQLADEGILPHEFTNIRRQMHAFWLLLGQTVSSVTESEIPRAYARRARRAGLPARVTVIRLRRKAGHAEGIGESAVEWQHRWWSRGHWRWQHVSEHHPLAESDGDGGWIARLWVQGSIKGPEGKPLRISNKVYRLAQ